MDLIAAFKQSDTMLLSLNAERVLIFAQMPSMALLKENKDIIFTIVSI